MSVTVQTTPAFSFGRATMLFESPTAPTVTPNASYDVAANGRFLMIKTAAPPATVPTVHVVLNWRAGMAK